MEYTYTMTFTEEELILLILCLHREMGVFSNTPQHSALLNRMLTERYDTLVRAKGLEGKWGTDGNPADLV